MRELAFDTIVARLMDFRFPEVDLVVGIETGGIVGASLVAYKLGRALTSIGVHYRDEMNQPEFETPKLTRSLSLHPRAKRILLVDDVAVTGQTLSLAKDSISGAEVITFVLKGKADYVLFPEIPECVHWPWKNLKQKKGEVFRLRPLPR